MSPRKYYKYQKWYTQSRPRVKRLPYHMEEKTLGALWGETEIYPPDIESAFTGRWYGDRPTALNKAYDKFKSSLSESASLAETLAERADSVDMIVKRSTQLFRFANALRRYRFAEAARIVGCELVGPLDGKKTKRLNKNLAFGRKPVHSSRLRKSSKQLGSNFLEFHLGWEPLVKDIGAAVEVLQGDLPSATIRGTGRSLVYNAIRPNSWSYETIKCLTRVQLIADVAVTNPNLWLANSLGFVSPLGVMWALVPFSFVVDWFVNVQQVLDQFTDFVGLSISEPATTTTYELEYTYGRTDSYHPGGYSYTSFEMDRIEGLSSPIFQVKPFKGLSVWRGATSIALLVGALR